MFRSHSANEDAAEAWENMISALSGARDSTVDVAAEARHRLGNAVDALAGRRSRRTWGMAAIAAAAGLAVGVLVGAAGIIAARAAIIARRERRELGSAEDDMPTPREREEILNATASRPTS